MQLFSSLILNKISINLLPNEILLEVLENLINYTSYKHVTPLKIGCKTLEHAYTACDINK